MDYAHREVFPSAPLALVATEVRFNDSPRLRLQQTIDAISIALESMLPVQEPYQSVELEMGPTGPQPRQSLGRTFKNLTSTTIATLTPDRLTLETTAYSHFAEFREQLLTCCRALVTAEVTPALRRIGLRYIDEIRVPEEVGDLRAWSKWVNPSLVAHLDVGPEGATVLQAEGSATYRLDADRGLNFRYAALTNGAVVSPTTLVRDAFDSSRPVFVLDFDGYREFSDRDETLLTVDEVANVLNVVHDPSGAMFQSSITDAARDIFREDVR